MGWTAPSNNGSPITQYILYKDNGLGIFYVIYRGLSLTYTDYGLADGGSYTYKVVAVNAAGTGTESDTLVGIAGSLPSAPQNVRIVTESSTELKLAWDAPADTGGLAISSYIVNEDSADLVYGADTSVTVLEYTKTINVADIGKRFSFKVAAMNTLGKGDYATDISLLAADAPDAPSMSLVSRKENSLYLKFSPGASNGGSDITGYQLYRDEGISGSPYTLIANVSSEQILYNATSLVSGRDYTFNLYASNAAHLSTVTTQSWIVGSAPGKANDPKLYSSSRGTVGGTTGTITIQWEALEVDSSLLITDYLLYIDNQGDGNYGTAVTHTDLTNLQYQFTGLADGAQYGIKIQAENVIDQGEESNVVYLAAAGVPDAPAQPVFETATNISISIAWSPPTETGGSSITGYKVYMNDFKSDKITLIYDGSSAPSVLSLTQSGLSTGSKYRFAVSAVNRVGESDKSDFGTFY